MYQHLHSFSQAGILVVFLRKGVMKICRKFTGEHPCRNVISIKLLSNFIEIALQYGCPAVNLLYIFRAPFPKNTPGWLLLACACLDKTAPLKEA